MTFGELLIEVSSKSPKTFITLFHNKTVKRGLKIKRIMHQ